MPPKPTCQQLFMSALCAGDTHQQSSWITNRIAIYQNNMRETLRRSLQLTYTGTWKLLGQQCADSLAYDYIRQQDQLPNSGCLDDWGGGFPTYLQTMDVLSAYPYVPDFARYEWLQHKCYRAPQKKPLGSQVWHEIVTQTSERLNLKLSPTIRLIASSHSLDRILGFVNSDGAIPISHRGQGVYGVLFKDRELVVCTAWVSEFIYQFVANLWEGKDLQTIEAMPQYADNAMAIQEAFEFLIDHGLIVGFG